MAIRTSASTGIIISLVVFVLLTVLLLIGSILLYSDLGEAKKNATGAQDALSEYVTKQERASDWLAAMDSRSGRDSVVGYMWNESDAIRQYGFGLDGGATLEDVQTFGTTAGVPEGSTLAIHVTDLNRQLQDANNAAQVADQNAKTAQAVSDDLRAQLAMATGERESLLAMETARLQPYVQADATYAAKIDDAVTGFNDAQQSSRTRNRTDVARLKSETDKLREDNVRLRGRLAEYESRMNRDRLKSADPAMLVDGHIIDVVGSGDHVYIDLGRNDQVTLGMQFEVYDGGEQIQIDPKTGVLPRGKASLQIVKVGDDSSNAKVTRSVDGRPIIRGNVIANGVYDPSYQFKFLVHGQFDANHDGTASKQEAEYIRERIGRWGGDVIRGKHIPGDLDFLVLGVEPANPLPLRENASTPEYGDYQRQREIVDLYEQLFTEAREAGIPVLNQNRLYILTGQPSS